MIIGFSLLRLISGGLGVGVGLGGGLGYPGLGVPLGSGIGQQIRYQEISSVPLIQAGYPGTWGWFIIILIMMIINRNWWRSRVWTWV